MSIKLIIILAVHAPRFHQNLIIVVIAHYACIHTVPDPCLITNGGCSHSCLLSIVDPRGYSCGCPEGMMLGDDSHSCIIQNDAPPLSPYGSYIIILCIN